MKVTFMQRSPVDKIAEFETDVRPQKGDIVSDYGHIRTVVDVLWQLEGNQARIIAYVSN